MSFTEETTNNNELSGKSINFIKSTANSMRIFAITSMVMMGLVALALLYFTVTIMSLPGAAGAIILMLLAFGYVGFSFFILTKLLSCANSYGAYVSSHSSVDLENALTFQKEYWKYYGILIIATIAAVIIALILVFTVLQGMLEAFF